MNKNRKQDELDKELKQDRIRDKELNDVAVNKFISDVMVNIEKIREERIKKFKESSNSTGIYTQEYIAKKAGVSLSAYKDYLSGKSDNISLKAVWQIKQTLHCDFTDIFKSTDI